MNAKDMREAMGLEPVDKCDTGGMFASINDKFIDLMQKGDPRCEYKLGDRVEKATFKEGDAHQKGTIGIVIGSIYADGMPDNMNECYLVQFKGDNHACFTTKYKIKLLE